MAAGDDSIPAQVTVETQQLATVIVAYTSCEKVVSNLKHSSMVAQDVSSHFR
jgi:hypothetical protein